MFEGISVAIIYEQWLLLISFGDFPFDFEEVGSHEFDIFDCIAVGLIVSEMDSLHIRYDLNI